MYNQTVDCSTTESVSGKRRIFEKMLLLQYNRAKVFIITHFNEGAQYKRDSYNLKENDLAFFSIFKYFIALYIFHGAKSGR